MPRMFNLGTNLMNSFRAGWPNGPENFYIAGRIVNDKAIISCRILSPQGNLLFELQNNDLTPQSLAVYRKVGFQNGWEICDENNYTILTLKEEKGIFNIYGKFYNKQRRLVAEADENCLLCSGGCPIALG